MLLITAEKKKFSLNTRDYSLTGRDLTNACFISLEAQNNNMTSLVIKIIHRVLDLNWF